MDRSTDAVPNGDHEERYRALYGAIASAVVVQSPSGMVVYANAAAEETLGLPVGRMRTGTAERVAEIADAAGRPLTPEEYPARRALSAGVPQRQVTIRVRRPDVDELWLQVDAVPLLDAHGQPEAVVSTMVDITERQRAEQAQRESEARFRTLVQNSSDILMVVNARGRITYISPAVERVLGYKPEEMIGTHVTSTMHPEDVARVARAAAPGDLFEPGVNRATVTRARHADGSWRYLESVINNLEHDPTIRGTVGNLRDVTERVRYDRARRFLAEAGNVLSASLNLQETMDALVRLVVPRLADRCTIDTTEADGTIQRVAVAAEDPEKEQVARELQERFPLDLSGNHPIALVLRTGSSILEPVTTPAGSQDVAGDPEFLRLLRQLGSRSRMTVPLVARGKSLGVISFVIVTEDRRFDEADLALAEEFARRAALAVDNARLYEAAEGAREQLHNQLDFTSAITESIAEGVYAQDRGGRLTFMNPAAEQLLGWTQAELIGRSMHEAIHFQDADSIPRPRESCPLVEVVRGGKVVHLEEDVFTRKDGTLLPVSCTSSPIVIDGRITGAVLAFRDITERKRAEEKERESLARLQEQYRDADRARGLNRAVLDATSEAMALVSPSGQFIAANRRFTSYFRIPFDRLIGSQFEDLWPELSRIFADPEEFRARLSRQGWASDQHYTEMVTQVWPERRELQLYSVPAHGRDGEFLGRLYVYRDVTHEREVDRMKTEFVSLVSHELRTPLTSIKGYVDLLLDGEVGPLAEEQLEFLGIVRSNADRLVSLINDLLDVSRIEAGRVELDRQPLDMRAVIEHVARSLRPQIEGKDQTLTLEMPPALPAIAGDVDRVTQVVTNLLSNAHKYTPAGGQIIMRAGFEETLVRVEVQDSGIGMSEEEQGKLFTKFFRSGNRAVQEVGGTGLGLAITRSLVEMHGGEISFTSAPGAGSTFSFTLPMAEASAPPPMPAELLRPGGRVLVVDDEPDIANLVRRYLERAGYAVLLAHTAADALRLARSEQPDLITLDIMLPDADGFTVLEWLKNDAVTAAIPVVVLSIVPDGGSARGADDVLSKPVQEQVLLEHVGRLIAVDRSSPVLVVDDDADARRLLITHLRRAGRRVLEAASGEEAVRIAREQHPAMVLMDIRMPGMDGVTALGALRADPETHDLPVVMMTASPGLAEENRSTIELLGSSLLVSKPGTAEELSVALARGLARRTRA